MLVVGTAHSRTSWFIQTRTNCFLCAKYFFLTTLGFHPKNDAVVTSVMASTPRNASTAAPDNRGKHTPSNKMNVSRIRQHILRYHPQVSHYRREHAPNRRYLSNDITIRSMHNDYLETFPDVPCSDEMYRKCISAENISFTKLGEEQCEVCLVYYNSHDSKTCRYTGLITVQHRIKIGACLHCWRAWWIRKTSKMMILYSGT